MRNFLLVKEVAKSGITDITTLTQGKLVLFGDNNAIVDDTAAAGMTRGIFYLGSGKPEVAPAAIPFYRHHFSLAEMNYSAGEAFAATITNITTPVIGDYTVIVAKKGVPFNERNKWTSTVYVKDTNMSQEAFVDKIVAAINANTVSSGVSATKVEDEDTEGVFNIELACATVGVDYEIKLSDGFADSSADVAISQHAEAPRADNAMIVDMANKAAADAGYHDTYVEDAQYLYPNYPIGRSDTPVAPYGADVFTIRFAEPRETRTVDEEIHQIVQFAVPRTSSGRPAAYAALKSLLESLL